jgi:predicted CoA-substrate-specific enzyme activase
MITAGIDIGSRNCKLILWNRKENRIIYKAQQESGTTPGETAEKQIEKACEIHNLKRDMLKICATGYGRKLINLDYISEISCHGRGVKVLLPEAATVIDIGGQDSKVISLDERGNVQEFAMNDKCAAGTGCFLEKIAELFRLKIDSLGELALHSKKRIEISSTCVVFAESEIISLINKKVGRDDILMGVHRSIAKRIKNLLSMIRWQAPLIMTGGVALNPAIQAALAEELQIMISVPEYPIFTGALGAALFASDIDQCPNERKRIT